MESSPVIPKKGENVSVIQQYIQNSSLHKAVDSIVLDMVRHRYLKINNILAIVVIILIIMTFTNLEN